MVGISFITAEDGASWLRRPVMRGLIKGESLFSTEIDLNFIADLNEELDIMDYNQRLYEDYVRSQK